MAGAVRIFVWSDYVCPFCYLQEPVLARVRQEYVEAIDVIWRAVELHPEPIPTLDPDGEYLHSIWDRVVYPMAQQRGMILRLPPVQPRSRKAFESAEFARDKERFEEMHRALFRAFFEEGRDLDNSRVLLDIGASVGLDPQELDAALQSGKYRNRVIKDEIEAAELGISAVPTMLIDSGAKRSRVETISGAQPYELLKDAIERALLKS
jgi:predicted DsbA family dithiol-disulfide isomerase